MAATLLFANNATTSLAAAISTAATSCTVLAGTGALFPTPGANQIFKMTFTDNLTKLVNEIVNVTAVSGDTFTIVRGQEGTAAAAWLVNDLATQMWTAGSAEAMVQEVQFAPTRFVTASGAFVTNVADQTIGLQRSNSLAASSTILPSAAQPGQSYTYEDLLGNFNAFPVTIAAPAGHNIAGLASVVLNVDRQSAIFTYYGANGTGLNLPTWGVKL